MLAQKLILGYSSRIISQVISMAAGIAVARLAGPTVLGTVAFGMSFVSMFQFIADMGLGSAHVKLVSEGSDQGVCNSTFGRIKVSLVAGFVVIVFATIMIQRVFFPGSFESPEHFSVVLVWLIAIALGQLSQIPSSTFAALTEQAKQDVPAFFQTILVQGLRLGAVLLGLGALGLSVANLIGVALLLLVYFSIYKSYPKGKYDAMMARRYLNLALPIMVIVFCNTQIEYLDKVMLQYFSNSEQVGYYSAANSIAGFVRTIGMTVGLLFFPLFSSAVARNDYAYVNRILERFERFTYVVIMPFVIFAMVCSSHIVRVLLGGRFVASTPIVAVMVIGMFFFVLNMPYGNVLTAMSRFRLTAFLSILNLVLFVGLNTLLPTYLSIADRALGTSVAFATSIFCIGYAFRFAVWRTTKQVTVWRHEKYLVFGVVIAAGSYYLGKVFAIQDSVVSAIVFAIPFFGIVYGVMIVAGWATRDDLKLVLQVTDIKKMQRYIRSEFTRD